MSGSLQSRIGVRGDRRCLQGSPSRIAAMEAVLIALMALVVLLTGWVSLVVLYKLFKTDS